MQASRSAYLGGYHSNRASESAGIEDLDDAVLVACTEMDSVCGPIAREAVVGMAGKLGDGGACFGVDDQRRTVVSHKDSESAIWGCGCAIEGKIVFVRG